MKTKIDIISGFLGAGKTTLIKKLLEGRLSSEKLVIIENEFGEIGIDGSILKNSKVEVKEINSGCICCTLVGDFKKAIEEVITKYKPDRIIIEPSGVGKLSDVIKGCAANELKDLLKINMITTVVDVLNYDMYLNNFGEFFENQIKSAKTIILSRVEKSDAENLEFVVNSIGTLNPNATIITTSLERLHSDIIINVSEEDRSLLLENKLKNSTQMFVNGKMRLHSSSCGCKTAHSHNHSADEVFQTWSIATPKVYFEKELLEILDFIKNDNSLGMILRGKGILQVEKEKWLQFDYVPGELKVQPISPDYTGRICIIGENLDKKGLCKIFQTSTLSEV